MCDNGGTYRLGANWIVGNIVYIGNVSGWTGNGETAAGDCVNGVPLRVKFVGNVTGTDSGN